MGAAEEYSRAGQGVVNAFSGGLFDTKSGALYNFFDNYNEWGGFGTEKNSSSEAFNTGMTGGRVGLPLFLVPVAMRVYRTYSPCLEQGGA